MTLPPQPWTDRPEAARLLAALEAGTETRMVGGAVRDALLGRPSTDIDLATRFEPAEVVRRTQAAGLKTIPTGIEHGTVTVLADRRPYEVTTLRRDVATDGRRATIAFAHDWREDAARRDFTLNALYADPLTGEVFDYYDGLADLARAHVRFIGDPLRRIAEDHLRILRFFRFHARFGRGEPDPAGLAACAARANDLMALSRERIRDEFLKLLAAPDPTPTLRLMLAHAILAPVLPEATDTAALAALVAAEQLLPRAAEDEPQRCLDAAPTPQATLAPPDHAALAPSPLRRLAALLPTDAALLESVAHRLRLSTAERKRLAATALRADPLADDPITLAYWHGRATAADLWLLAGRDPAALARLTDWSRPKPPLSGADLIAAGMAPGPAVASRLRAIEERWVASGFRLSREALLTTQ